MIPLGENVAAAGNATANLDNNTGALTRDEQELVNLAVGSGN
jgi:large repetitive protein